MGNSKSRVFTTLEAGLLSAFNMSNHVVYTMAQQALQNPKADEPLTKVRPAVDQALYRFKSGVNFVELNWQGMCKEDIVLVYFGGIGTTLNENRDVCLDVLNASNELGVKVKVLTIDHMKEPDIPSVLEDGIKLCKFGLRNGGKLCIASHSLGSGIAAQVALECERQTMNLCSLVLCSPYITLAKAQSWKIKWLSDRLMKYMLGSDLRTIDIFPLLNVKVFIVGGENDDVIPSIQGEQLRESRPENTEILVVKGGDHGSTYKLFSKNIEYLRRFLCS